MADPLSASDLLDQMEQLSPVALEEEIATLKERIGRAERMLKIIKGDPLRQPRSGDGTATKPSIDKSIPSRDRVAAFLAASGPTGFRVILASVGMMPGPLKELLTGDGAFVWNEGDKTWSLKRSAK